MLTNFPANIPTSWLQDIATIGTSGITQRRNSIWEDWTEKQRLDALKYYSGAINKLSETIDIVDNLNRKIDNDFSCAIYSFESSTGIDCSIQYTCKELIDAILNWQQKEEEYVNNAIKECQELFG